jgi:hypothetical protein
MQNEPVKLLDVVELLVDKPSDGLLTGHAGTVVEVFSPEDFEVEFLDPEGHAFALLPIPTGKLMLLHDAPTAVAA